MTILKFQNSSVTTSDGVQLHCVEHPVINSHGTVLLVHGLGEHSARYDHVVQVMNRSGLSVMRFDHRGHGLSPGRRGHIPSYETFLDDLSLVANRVIENRPNQKIVLYGHSMGGGIVANWALRRFDDSWSDHVIGAVLSAPWFRLTSQLTLWQKLLAFPVAGVFPKLTISTKIHVTQTCRSDDAIERFQRDSLNHRRISLRTLTECYRAGQFALANAERFPLPILAVHGSADRVTSPEATREFCSKINDARFIPLDDLIHEPHHDPKWREVVYHTTEWVLKRYRFAFAA
ncbi:lysophospholipase [Thalassoglobus sp.]|uniref:alpha/beta hydrolase n=1 Tax=Thalassoglobus sp. TaxID=2795869 RepID=UPI003AA9C900